MVLCKYIVVDVYDRVLLGAVTQWSCANTSSTMS